MTIKNVCARCGNDRAINGRTGCIDGVFHVFLCGACIPFDAEREPPTVDVAEPEDDFDEARAKRWSEPGQDEAWEDEAPAVDAESGPMYGTTAWMLR